MAARRKRWETPVLALLFLFSLSLFNLAGYLFSAIAAAMLVFNVRRIRVSTPELLLFLFSVLFFGCYVFHYGFSAEAVILYLIGPWTAYILGKLYVERAGGTEAFVRFLAVPAAGMWAHGLLNWAAYLRSDYFALYDYYRQSVDFWRGTLVNVNATGMMFTFAAGISLGVLFSGMGRKRKCAAAGVLALCMAATVFFANRTLLAIVLVIAAFKGMGWFFGSRATAKAKLTAFLLLLLAAVVIFAVTAANVGGFRDRLNSLKLVQRIVTDDGSARLTVWKHFFAHGNFLDHPWGGKQMLAGSGFGYFHNLWLDVYHSVGVLPFLALTAFSLCMAGRFRRFRLVMLENGRRDDYEIFRCLAAAILLNCAVEPVIEGNPYYFLTALMFFGAMEGAEKKLSAGTDGNG